MSSVVAGKSVLVTGATAGIGLLAARALLRAGASVSLHGRDATRLAQARDALAGDGTLGRSFVADLASLAETAALAQRIAQEEPTLDVLVNNAGVGFGADRRKREVLVHVRQSPPGLSCRSVSVWRA